MSPGLLVAASAALLGLMGSIHLALTFRGPKLVPRDPSVREAMARVSPVITSQTTIWRMWIGFNASHSLGAMLFGSVYGYLALARPEVLFGSTFLLAVGLVTLAGFTVLAKRYWFVTPLSGGSVALALYVAGLATALVRGGGG